MYAVATGEGPPLVLLHGLFGMGSNLGALARSLSDRYRVFSLDLPNHGRSEALAGAGIPEMAQAVLGWMAGEGVQAARFVGHSLGGKVAMQIALAAPARALAVVVADIAPVAYRAGHREELAALQALADAHCASRSEANALMSGLLDNPEVIQFLLKNLHRGADGRYGLYLNLPEIIASYDRLRAAIESEAAYPGPVLFIKGGDSGYIRKEHRATIERLFPAAQLKVMPDCGHWLHAQKPQLFNSLVGRFLDASH